MNKIVILGGGESGTGAAILAKKKGHPVFVSDKGTLKEKYLNELKKYDIPFEEKQHSLDKILQADVIIKSPGVVLEKDWLTKIYNAKISVISEIEFAAKHTNAILIGITGSNGKTTTTALIYELLQQGGKSVGIGGNYGNSFAKMVAEENHDYYVLELSSFQLDDIEYFRPDVAVLLNISPDHLDRYNNDLDLYIASKFRIIKNQEGLDIFIYNAEDKRIMSYLENTELTQVLMPISYRSLENNILKLDNTYQFDMSQFVLEGPHNVFNTQCAIQVALSQGVNAEDIQKGINAFVNVPHRLERVATIEGVHFINDSKATNIDAVVQALRSVDENIILILGGVDKGNDYSEIMPLVEQKVKALICLGTDNEKLKKTFTNKVPLLKEASSMEEAVVLSKQIASAGDTVLLSPACASFDLFTNYMDRGNQFKEYVQQLIKPVS